MSTKHNKKPAGLQLPYGLSWAQYQRLPFSVQSAVSEAVMNDLAKQKAASDAWWDLVAELGGDAE